MKYEVLTPRIDTVLDRFRQRGPLSSETDAGEERNTEDPLEVWTTLVTSTKIACSRHSDSNSGAIVPAERLVTPGHYLHAWNRLQCSTKWHVFA